MASPALLPALTVFVWRLGQNMQIQVLKRGAVALQCLYPRRKIWAGESEWVQVYSHESNQKCSLKKAFT